jgi:hypothetical protein
MNQPTSSHNGRSWWWFSAAILIPVGLMTAMLTIHAERPHKDSVTQTELTLVLNRLERIESQLDRLSLKIDGLRQPWVSP